MIHLSSDAVDNDSPEASARKRRRGVRKKDLFPSKLILQFYVRKRS